MWGGLHWENWSKKCANPACSTRPFKTVFNGKGIQVVSDWFCSPDCAELDLQRRFAEFTGTTRTIETPRPARVPLGLMLYSRGYLTDEQFKIALETHRASGARIGDVALQLGFVSEEQVAAALSAQWGYPVCSLKGAPPDLHQFVPVRLMQVHQMLPIQFVEDTQKLLIGFATRVEHSVIQAVEGILACVASPCFVTFTEFRSRVHTFSSLQVETEFVSDGIATALDMAHTVKRYLIDTEATEVRISRCREYLWTRVLGSERPFDLLFRLEVHQG